VLVFTKELHTEGLSSVDEGEFIGRRRIVLIEGLVHDDGVAEGKVEECLGEIFMLRMGGVLPYFVEILVLEFDIFSFI
jgi:hypothetical protein